jgi:NAD+ kinase
MARAKPDDPARPARPRRVAILADAEKPGVVELARELQAWFAAERVAARLLLEPRAWEAGRAPACDLVVVLGGDGAILSAVRAYEKKPTPTIGINFGRVGFLASVEATHWRAALEDVLAGRARVEPRMRLLVEYRDARGQTRRATALNDAVLTRGAFQGMLEMALKVGNDWVTNYRADGLVVSTPSGSTAYSLAAGGPILAPALQALVVTPISPQALSHRPIVLDAAARLRLEITKAGGLTTLVVDGQGFHPLQEGDAVVMRAHAKAYPLLSPRSFDPFRRLRERLGWRGSVEPDVFPGRTRGRKPSGRDSGRNGVL